MRRLLLLALLSLPARLLMAQSNPVESRLEAARKRIEAEPKSAQPYLDLAFALCRKGRDTQLPAVYREAEEALHRALGLSPGNYEARKLQAVVLLGKHEYASALNLANELNHRVRDDIFGWALLVDANVALGNYAEAERAAQWVLDLRPGSTLGFIKAAGLRELFGDLEGAVEFLEEADRRTSRNDADERAWLLTENARLQIARMQLARAEQLLSEAAKLFAGSQHALHVQAKLLRAKGDYAGEAALLEKRYRAVDTAANLFDWACALERSGRTREAKAGFQEFERKARARIAQADNANLQLISFYADDKNHAAEALQLAVQQITVRHDTATLHAYAWALFQNGQYQEAYARMNEALAVGIRDPVYFCHAAQIAARSNHAAEVEKYTQALASFSDKSACSDTHIAHLERGASR